MRIPGIDITPQTKIRKSNKNEKEKLRFYFLKLEKKKRKMAWK